MIVPAVHDRACGHRGLLPAGRTFPARPAPLQFPAPVMAAGGADEAVGPALFSDIALEGSATSEMTGWAERRPGVARL